jgi:hypothetical protein
MRKWTGLLKQLISSQKVKSPDASRDKKQNEKVDDVDNEGSEGWEYINRVREKLDRLVEDFAKGRVNRAQFEELYSHYQEERQVVERLMTSRPSSDAWRLAVTEGQSVGIRRRLAARVLGYAVYANHDETPLRVYGEFASLNEKWVAPLLEKMRSDKLFTVGSFDTGSEGASCLCAVSGKFTTLLALFTTEPAGIQLQSLEDLHSHFEQANHRVLERHNPSQSRPLQVDDLVFPYAAVFE